ncbi:hypothetical protein SAMN04488077_12125 [Roseovarius tolerans]|uniref:DUF1150 domain-containing protein n=1 Tax=Roseovarius tolerans TaxID=74031 RepID=A0A1H8HRQ7_9RHOB|nr:DUF1150 family protein [Roseovarius tolerans]SEN58763.1 hypothetical protein SAMN04488077_12125 [Roseovarius tolerans]
MDTKYDFGNIEDRAIVYVRPVNVEDLPEDMREQVGDLTTLYAVHSTEGERLALVRDRKLAFLLARQNNMEPVTVH